MLAPAAPGNDRIGATSIGAAWYALVVMTVCYSLAFVDRQILNLLVEPMKTEFGATDAQAGYILGPAFTLSYVALGLPAGWCADRFNRRTLVLCAGILWSVATAAAAFVHSYHALFVTRVMVGGSEAFLFPAGMSLIADLFDRRRLPLATSVFLMSPYIGGGLALICGGLVLGYTMHLAPIGVPPIGVMKGWQVTFLVVGVLGLIPVLMLIPVGEPLRGRGLAEGEVEQRFGFVEGTVYMAKRWRFFGMFFFGTACSSLVLNTVSAWAPTYLTRAFAMPPAEIGVRYGVLVLVFGLAGGILSPIVNHVLARFYPDTPMRTVRIGPAIVALCGCALALVDTRFGALACLAVLTFGYSFPLSMAGTSLQLATPPRLRGLSSAFYFVIVSLIGLGLGPTLVPMLTGHVFHDPEKIGPALSIVAFVAASLAFVMLSVALKGFRIERGLAPDPRFKNKLGE